jgi:tRNA pseudouridine38-40 synthase
MGWKPMPRYKLTILYRGSRYHGWQTQPALPGYTGDVPAAGRGIPTIQETLSRAIGQVVGHPVSLRGSSRTDAGVHAKGQIVHFDTTQQNIPAEGLRRAVNHKLPGDILIRELQQVGPRFDAIRSTLSKRYQYFIWNSHDRPVFFNDLAWHRWQELDTAAMAKAAEAFVGEHDFASFARPGHGREHTVRTILSCDLSVRLPKLVIGIEGTGFLWNMVRIIVGTLVQVGLGRFTPEDMRKMLEAKDRAASGPTAPPHGLYLQWIRTRPEDDELEQPADAATESGAIRAGGEGT